MAEFLTTRGVSSHLEDIIKEGQNQIVLVRPYLQIPKIIYERLKDASRRGVEIILIYGKRDLNTDQKTILSELKTVKIYFHETLHAKCYFNEKKMIITSMNLFQYSETNNREMGVLIRSDFDKELFKNGLEEVESIVQHSKLENFQSVSNVSYQKSDRNTNSNKQKRESKSPTVGFCLRCENHIPYDPNRPYCNNCYPSWAFHDNPYFMDNVCHCCGVNYPASKNDPQCVNCDRKYPFM